MCIRDRLCERVTTLKESPEYHESMRAAQERSTSEQGRRDRELRSLEQQHAQQVQNLQQIIGQKDQTIAEQRQQLDGAHQQVREKSQMIEEKERQLRNMKQQLEESEQKDQTIAEQRQQLDGAYQLLREKSQVIEEKERQLVHINQQLKESELLIVQFQRRISELEQLRSATDRIKLTWRKGERAPFSGSSGSYTGSVVSGTLYVRLYDKRVYGYTASTSIWSKLPDSPTTGCPPCLLYTSPSPRDATLSRMPSSA